MKNVICMRGLPGSGKDTYIKECWGNDKDIVICSTDDYFMVNDEYRFDVSMLEEAHATCMRKFLHALASDIKTVIVNNTNINVWEIAPYAAVAAAMGYQFEIIELKAQIEHCIARNTHGVPAEKIGALAESMRREILPSHWSIVTIHIKPRDGNDPDVRLLIDAFAKRNVKACFAESEEEGLIDHMTIVPDKDSKDHFWVFPSYGGTCGWLSRSRISEMVRLILEAPAEASSVDIEEAVCVMADSNEFPCDCGSTDKLHYPSIHNSDNDKK